MCYLCYWQAKKQKNKKKKKKKKNTPHMSTSLCGKICITTPKCIRNERRHNFMVYVWLSWRRCVFPNMVRGVTFPSYAWGIRPITMHWIAGQSEHTLLLRTMSFVKTDVFQKGRAERSNNNVQFVENYVFLNLKSRKHIALHQIHQIVFF